MLLINLDLEGRGLVWLHHEIVAVAIGQDGVEQQVLAADILVGKDWSDADDEPLLRILRDARCDGLKCVPVRGLGEVGASPILRSCETAARHVDKIRWVPSRPTVEPCLASGDDLRLEH